MSVSEILIVENGIDDAPSQRVVRRLLSRMKKSGLKSDWDCVMVLEDGDLLFGRPEQQDHETAIIAGKRNGEWTFWTDTYEQLSLRARS